MVKYRKNEDSLVSTINITPFTDVILVLLIIFMISAPGLYQASFRIQLPGTESGTNRSDYSVTIAAEKEGQIYWNGEPVNREQLVTRLDGLEKPEEARILINADSELAHGRVVELVDLVRSTGATSVYVGTVPKERR